MVAFERETCWDLAVLSSTRRLVELLEDGAFHSGAELARTLDVTRAAVWKRIKRLQDETGLTVDAVPGRGYRLAEPLQLLDADRLQDRLQSGGVVERLWVLPCVDSTNSFLRRQQLPPVGKGNACLSEYQESGRGRRGRHWVSSYGRNLMLSLGWHFDLGLAGLSGLSLAVGVGVANLLTALGSCRHRLKWPNDVEVDGAKLAGILVEATGEAQGPAFAIVGVGLNVRMSEEQLNAIDRPATDLARQGCTGITRTDLAEKCVKALAQVCRQYAEEGIRPFLQSWLAFDGYLNREVVILNAGRTIAGRYVGIDGDGALLLERDRATEIYHAGEVSLRRRTDTP